MPPLHVILPHLGLCCRAVLVCAAHKDGVVAAAACVARVAVC
jgi:hypothetical protein